MRGSRSRTAVAALVLGVLLVAAAGGAAGVEEGLPEATPVTGGETRVSGPAATAHDHDPAVAYNATDNEYLVVWRDERNFYADIYGRRVSASGQCLGGDFQISGSAATAHEYEPAVAWNATANEYLVVWYDTRNGTTRGWDIYGQRVSATGARVGKDFRISGPGGTGDESRPAVAWNGISNQYLVVWEDTRNPTVDIYGQRVSATGVRMNLDFRISGPAATSDEQAPAVAWNGISNQYLVVWHDKRNLLTRSWDIYGRRVDRRGGRIGGDFRIATDAATAKEYTPAVAWTDATNQYLVVWADWRETATRRADIYGRRVDRRGNVRGGDIRISGPGATENDEWPAVAWNSTSDQFLVVWRDERSMGTRGWDIYGRELDQRGIRIGRDFRVSGPAATGHEYRPAAAWNSTDNQYLAVWHDTRDNSTRGYDIYGRRVSG